MSGQENTEYTATGSRATSQPEGIPSISIAEDRWSHMYQVDTTAVSGETELSIASLAHTSNHHTLNTHHSINLLPDRATDDDRRHIRWSVKHSRASLRRNGDWPQEETSDPISEVKDRLIVTAVTAVDVLSTSVANTGHKLRKRRGSVGISHKEGLHRITSQQKTDTDLSRYDCYCSSLHRKLYRAISDNHFDGHNNTGFLSRSKLLKILTADRIEKELRKRDTFLGRGPDLLQALRFPTLPHRNGHRNDFGFETQTILGNYSPILRGPLHPISENQSTSGNKSYVIILAILILIERPARIKLFIDAEVSDEDLPLIKHSSHGLLELHKTSAPNVSLPCFRKWSHTTKTKFERWQWAFLAPYFELADHKHVPHHKFHSSTILPFKPYKELRKGGFGEVRKVDIHKDHRAFSNVEPSNWCFAIKSLTKPQSNEDFKREVATLRRFSGRFHDHIISLLGTYEKDNAFHMIFPWAEADLFGFWQLKQTAPALGNPSSSDQTLPWVAEQCQGLADGLGYIHRHMTSSGKSLLHRNSMPLALDVTINATQSGARDSQQLIHLFGRHGDLKPENILWFARASGQTSTIQGTLKIADFGFVEFSRKKMVDKDRRGFVVLTPTYLPPEGELETRISSLYDIWSLGCIYLEFVVWWLGGWRRIDDFKISRLQADSTLPGWEGVSTFRSDLFFQVSKDVGTGNAKAEVKISVEKCINDSKEHPESNPFVRNFLDLIQREMLVVLNQEGTGRSCAWNIRDSIEVMRRDHLKYDAPEEV